MRKLHIIVAQDTLCGRPDADTIRAVYLSRGAVRGILERDWRSPSIPSVDALCASCVHEARVNLATAWAVR